MDLTIYKTDTSLMLTQMLLPHMIERLPASLRARAIRYKSEISACNYVAGRLLLKHGLEVLDLNTDLLQIEYKENGKPVLSGVPFNISHSDHQVICAFANVGELGVDIEKIKPIDFSDFEAMFSEREWVQIYGAENSLTSFYWFWTRKESIIKALGLTLGYLHEIELDVATDGIIIDGKQWYLSDLALGDGYVGAVCSEEKIDTMEFRQFDI